MYCPSDVFRGDIIRLNSRGLAATKYYRVKSDMNSNNGSFVAVDMLNRVSHFSTITDDFAVVKRA